MPALPSHELVRATHAHLASVAVVLFKTHQVAQHAAQLVDMSVPAALRADVAAGGVIFASAHLGHWELLPALLPTLLPSTRCAYLYRPLRNARVDEVVKRQRCRWGAVPVAVDAAALQRLAQALAARDCVCMLPDVRPSHGGVTVTFAGSQRDLPPGLGRLHARTGAPVWLALVIADEGPSGVVRRPFSVVFVRVMARAQPTEGAIDPALVASVMQAYADALGPLVVAHATQYLWSHRMSPDAYGQV